MERLKFSTVKLIPSLVRDESINIGVIVHDSEKNMAYPKFTNNWKEISRRTNISTIPGLEKILKLKSFHVEKDYLDTLSLDKTTDSLYITKPRPVSIIETIDKTLDTLFDIQISIK